MPTAPAFPTPCGQALDRRTCWKHKRLVHSASVRRRILGGGHSPRFHRTAFPAARSATFLDNLIAASAKILYPRNGAVERLTELAMRLDVQGARIFDLQIGLICQDAGAREIWSHDRNFIAVPGLAVNDPL
jgi:hypothetical protein